MDHFLMPGVEVLQNTRFRIFSNTFAEYMTSLNKKSSYLYDLSRI
ncbi:hypothetical protein EDWATA_03208 [Edwardsiella tarda ATCC 23685]|uniref:Uncharacterized protein n=1 Tax=Edwardsiella tarda ATCC 23685 TaxID=500638 RepID=D4F8V4_EDWTA|nr:hypothetical protein EDWATA_03208 [Edwardsiella tarda ATCC 23685]